MLRIKRKKITQKSLAEIDQQIDDTLTSVSLDNTIVIITAEHGKNV